MSWDAAATIIAGILVSVLWYWAGYTIGYRSARKAYLPSLIEQSRDYAKLIDDFSRLIGRESDAVERERKWEDKLRDMGLEVPDE